MVSEHALNILVDAMRRAAVASRASAVSVGHGGVTLCRKFGSRLPNYGCTSTNYGFIMYSQSQVEYSYSYLSIDRSCDFTARMCTDTTVTLTSSCNCALKLYILYYYT